MTTWIIVIAALVVVVQLVRKSMRTVPLYEQLVVRRLSGTPIVKDPGRRVVLPFLDVEHRVDTRPVVAEFSAVDIHTSDGVPLTVTGVVHSHVRNPVALLANVADQRVATAHAAQSALQWLVPQHPLEVVADKRDELTADLTRTTAHYTHEWGIEVTRVEIRSVALPQSLRAALNREMEERRLASAKAIQAQGELEAARILKVAAQELEGSPIAVQLRQLMTLRDIASEQSSTIVVPLPVELARLLDGVGAQPRQVPGG
jgi:regulator of protease activity HflC (stomatin/prohibitin superfamily)